MVSLLTSPLSYAQRLVSESGAITCQYLVRLNKAPTASVTISPVQASPAQFSTSGNFFQPLTFTTTNWNTAQVVTLTGVDDSIDEADAHVGTVTHAAVSSDSDYNGISVASVSVTIHDTGEKLVKVSESVLASAAEGGSSQTFTVVIETPAGQPSGDTTVEVICKQCKS